ncbi:helix-turn-helix domain-containing protein [Micromonospora chersina]|uniref:helix-turn-helix domain-containing protein n=1 Tax=Micromonospora chersina TaxID=47854 RepID=UPI003C806162
MGEQAAGQPTMLVLTRESRGMTQAEVAARMKELGGGAAVSQGYVSKAEAGRLVIAGDRLNLFARAVHYPVSVLCADPDVHGVGVGLVHHRKKASLGGPALRRVHAELALSRLQVRALLTAAQHVREHRFRRIEIDDFNTPIDAAIEVRKEWGIPGGPVRGLLRLIENAGGLVLVRDLGTQELDAVTQWTEGEAPLFLLNADAPADRFRFSLAHELGHLFLHPEPGPTATQERQADEFASEFLMPAVDVRTELKGRFDLNRLLDLKHRWEVSMAAIARRALTLGVISDWQYRNVMVEMSALGYRTQEPGSVEREDPCLMRYLVDQLYTEQGHTANTIADLVGLLPDEVELLYPAGAGTATR